MSTCDDTRVPYGVWLFSFFLESHLLPQRGCTESDIYDHETLVQIQPSEIAVGRWWACMVMLSAVGGHQIRLSLCLRAVHAVCHALWLANCISENSCLLLNAQNFCYDSNETPQERENFEGSYYHIYYHKNKNDITRIVKVNCQRYVPPPKKKFAGPGRGQN